MLSVIQSRPLPTAFTGTTSGVGLALVTILERASLIVTLVAGVSATAASILGAIAWWYTIQEKREDKQERKKRKQREQNESQ